MKTVRWVKSRFKPVKMAPLPAPPYRHDPDNQVRVGLAVHSMKDHVTDEGWQIFVGLKHSGGYKLTGIGVTDTVSGQTLSDCTDVAKIVATFSPGTCLVQDQREWDGMTAGRGFDPREQYTNLQALRESESTFKLTIIKDAHHRQKYHADSAALMGAHAWVTYYHPDIICHLAPYVRRHHVIRTYHSIDSAMMPPYKPEGRLDKALLSGAVSWHYPLRQRITACKRDYPKIDVLKHPGYKRDRCHTYDYYKTLSMYKVCICTSSVYGYLLRKIPEAVAAGCVVITDLPQDDPVPGIDGYLVRISPDIPAADLNALVDSCIKNYDPARQWYAANTARTMFDYRTVCGKLASDIEALRCNYGA